MRSVTRRGKLIKLSAVCTVYSPNLNMQHLLSGSNDRTRQACQHLHTFTSRNVHLADSLCLCTASARPPSPSSHPIAIMSTVCSSTGKVCPIPIDYSVSQLLPRHQFPVTPWTCSVYPRPWLPFHCQQEFSLWMSSGTVSGWHVFARCQACA